MFPYTVQAESPFFGTACNQDYSKIFSSACRPYGSAKLLSKGVCICSTRHEGVSSNIESWLVSERPCRQCILLVVFIAPCFRPCCQAWAIRRRMRRVLQKCACCMCNYFQCERDPAASTLSLSMLSCHLRLPSFLQLRMNYSFYTVRQAPIKTVTHPCWG